MNPASLLDGDLRALRRWIAVAMIFLLLPWLFIAVGASFPRWPTGQEEPARLPTAVPVPTTYPIVVRYVPMPAGVIERWIQTTHPGSLITLGDVRRIALAAKKMDVSLPLLVGIMGAEQGFLQCGAGNCWHALLFHENPFDYGVYPGSSFPFNIGVYQSALGAADMVAQVVESFRSVGWTPATFSAFMAALSGYYVNGSVLRADRSWQRNAAIFTGAVWNAVTADMAGYALWLVRTVGVSALEHFVAQAVGSAERLLGKVRSTVGQVVQNALAAIGVPVAVAAGIAAFVAVLAEMGSVVAAAA